MDNNKSKKGSSRLMVQFPKDDAKSINEINDYFAYERMSTAARNAAKVGFLIFKSNPDKFRTMLNNL